MNAIVFKAYPPIKNRLKMATKKDKHYVVQEYMNETHWLILVFRLFLIDLFANQSFRKDIYKKGKLKPFPVEQIKKNFQTILNLVKEKFMG